MFWKYEKIDKNVINGAMQICFPTIYDKTKILTFLIFKLIFPENHNIIF